MVPTERRCSRRPLTYNRAMDETLHQRCLDALHRTLAAEVGPQASARVVVLFGSQASGRARASSDVDLGIALEAPMDAALRERVAASVAASIGRDVDLVDLLTAPSHLVSQALRTGTLLAGARSPALADLVCKMVAEREDIAPYQRRMLEARNR